MVVDHPTTGDTATDAPEPSDELRRGHSGREGAVEVPPDLADIPSPEDYRAAVDAKYREHAIETGCARVREIEQNEITPAMRRIEAADPTRHLVGFEHRLKSEERIREKVDSYTRANAEISHEQAFAKIKDAVRYTFEYQEEHYAQGVLDDCKRLEAAGFEQVDLRNTWENEEYKGINSRWRVSQNGQMFEVQFHTRDSFETKQATHLAYEKIRAPETPQPERERLSNYQREISARIPIPPNAADIPNYPQEMQ